jgi:hypothetical protein
VFEEESVGPFMAAGNPRCLQQQFSQVIRASFRAARHQRRNQTRQADRTLSHPARCRLWQRRFESQPDQVIGPAKRRKNNW